MNSFRLAFLTAFVLLAVGVVAGHSLAASLFAAGDARKGVDVAIAGQDNVTATATTSTPRPTATPTAHASATATPAPTPARTPTTTPTAAPSLTPTPTAAPHPTATPPPTLTATPGIVELARYWVGAQMARRGRTVAIGYVIDNTTGRTEHLLLGASVKPSTASTWAQSIDDTYHDVVAVVPPGTTTHVRYFTLSTRLRPGAYDVAWGLRNAATGERVALVAAAGALTITR
jgi:hypothetical protein